MSSLEEVVEVAGVMLEVQPSRMPAEVASRLVLVGVCGRMGKLSYSKLPDYESWVAEEDL